MKDLEPVLEVLLILSNLNRRVQQIALPAPDPTQDEFVRLRLLAALPLLELNDHRVVGGGWVPAAKHAVEPHGSERELILEEDASIAQLA